MLKKETLKQISEILNSIPRKWVAEKVILEMKVNKFNQWKQMEWIGFYFEFLCQQYFGDTMEYHKIKYGNTSFDGFLEVPFDFKSHAINSSNNDVVINDTESITKAIKKYGCMIAIIALGKAKYNDEDRTFQKWHEKIKGGKSKYELKRIERGAWSRLRKTEMDIGEIIFVKINKGTLDRSGSFQKNFRNVDGSLRRSKVKINLDKLKDNEIIHRIKFR